MSSQTRHRTRQSYGRLTGRPARRRNEWLIARNPICATSGCWAPAAEVDHIVPLHRGGTEDLSNLQGLCKACHARKTASERRAMKRARKHQPPPEWAALLKELLP